MKNNNFICGLALFISIFSFNPAFAKYKIVEIQRYLLSDKYQIGFCDSNKVTCNSANQFSWVNNNSDISADNFYFAIREKNNPDKWFLIRSTKLKKPSAFKRTQFERVAIWYLDIMSETALPADCVPNTKIDNVNAIFNSYGEEAPAVDQTEIICE